MSTNEDRPKKIGEGHLKAMGLLGVNELGGAFFTGSNVVQPREPGIFGPRTPGENSENRRPTDRDMEEERGGSVLAEREAEIQSRAERAQPERSMEMERE